MKKIIYLLSSAAFSAPSILSLSTIQSCGAVSPWVNLWSDDNNLIDDDRYYTVISDLVNLSGDSDEGTKDSDGNYIIDFPYDNSIGAVNTQFENYLSKKQTYTNDVKLENYEQYADTSVLDYFKRVDTPFQVGDANIYKDTDGNIDIDTLNDVYDLWINERVALIKNNYEKFINKHDDKFTADDFADLFTTYFDIADGNGYENGFIASSDSFTKRDNYFMWNSTTYKNSAYLMIQSIMDSWIHISFDESNNIGTIYWAKVDVKEDLSSIRTKTVSTTFKIKG